MSSNEMRQILAHLPDGVGIDLVRYGISLQSHELETVEIEPLPEERPEQISTDGCVVIEMPTEVVIYDYPITGNWCEVLPARTRVPPLPNRKERSYDDIAS